MNFSSEILQLPLFDFASMILSFGPFVLTSLLLGIPAPGERRPYSSIYCLGVLGESVLEDWEVSWVVASPLSMAVSVLVHGVL